MAMARRAILKEIKERSKGHPGFNFRTSTRFYMKIPLSSAHANHPVGESSTIGQYVDRRIIDKVYDLVNHNITNFSDVERCLDRYVEDELFSGQPNQRRPKKTSRRYYPCRQDLRNYVGKAISHEILQ